MERLHGISARIVHEHVWTRVYVKGMSPEQAAGVPEVPNYFTREPGERLHKMVSRALLYIAKAGDAAYQQKRGRTASAARN